MERENDIHIYRHLISAYFLSLILTATFIYPMVPLLKGMLGQAYVADLLKAGPWQKAFTWVEMAGSVAALLFWFRPLARFLSGDFPQLREQAVARFSATYKVLIWIAAANLALDLLAGAVFGYRLPAEAGFWGFIAVILVPELLYLCYFVWFAILYLEPVLFEKVALRLYGGDELYRRKRGLSFSIRTRLFMMIVSLAVIPMALVAANIAMLQDPAIRELRTSLIALMLLALACIAGYSEMIYRGVTKPLAELVKKMGRLAEGDFGVRTSVLSDDEIGSLKAHFNDMVGAMEERERIKDTFGKYVSIEIARQLMASGKIKLGGDSITATILFSDIRGFTPLSEKLPPDQLVKFLNTYFSHIVGPITRHHGVVNKFIGDAVMAIFAPQFGSENHVEDAVRAALGMKEKLKDFNLKGLGPGEVRFGVGLHTGVLVAGNIGTEQRLEYTVIGDTVNIASRIESANKSLDSTILVSEEVYKGIGEKLRSEAGFTKCEDITLKGKERAMTLYSVG